MCNPFQIELISIKEAMKKKFKVEGQAPQIYNFE
jgi:hypothetical protein